MAARQHGGLEGAAKLRSVGLKSYYASVRARTNIRVRCALLRATLWRIWRYARCESRKYQVETKQTGGKMKYKLFSHSFAVLIAVAIGSLLSAISALAAVSLNGQVFSGGGPVANSAVTLWAATAGAPTQLGKARTGADGRFTIAATT